MTDTDTAGNTANASISFTLNNAIATPDSGTDQRHRQLGQRQYHPGRFAELQRGRRRRYPQLLDRWRAIFGELHRPDADGDHTVVVTDTNTAGNTANASISFTLDNTIATPTVALTSDTGSSSSDNITQDGSLTASARLPPMSPAASRLMAGHLQRAIPPRRQTATIPWWSPIPTPPATPPMPALVSRWTIPLPLPTVTLASDTGSSGSDNISKDGSLSFSMRGGRRHPQLLGRRRRAVGKLHCPDGRRRAYRGGDRYRHRRQHHQCQHQLHPGQCHCHTDSGADQRHRQFRQRQHYRQCRPDGEHGCGRRYPQLLGRRRSAVGELYRPDSRWRPHRGGD